MSIRGRKTARQFVNGSRRYRVTLPVDVHRRIAAYAKRSGARITTILREAARAYVGLA